MGNLLMCARCKRNVRASQGTGCLCDKCEDAIYEMTQEELDADWEAHQGPRPYRRHKDGEA